MWNNLAYRALFVVAGIGLITFHATSGFNYFFEILFLFFVGINLYRFNLKMLPLQLAIGSYLLYGVYASVIRGGHHILDYLLIYKFFVYAFGLTFLVGKEKWSQERFNKLYKWVLYVFLIKYLLSVIVFQDFRPTLFHENNYELMLLALMSLLNLYNGFHVGIREQLILTLIFLLSGSKSGLLILLFLLIVINRKWLISKMHVFLPSFFLLFSLVLTVFKHRMGGEFNIERIDRFKFLMVFLDEVKDWSFSRFIFGAPRITALSEYACNKLGYYQSLFSYSGDGSCYSVIFHSYLMRVIFDHGILGLLFVLFIIYRVLWVACFTSKQIMVVLGIVVINGLSVSSFNSIYFIIGLCFFLIVSRNGMPAQKPLQA